MDSVGRSTAMKRGARIALPLFATSFLAYAFFHPGGGWNQNARFAMTRALVETRQLSIDGYLVYERDADSRTLRRLPVRDGLLLEAGGPRPLAWPGGATVVPGAAGSPVSLERRAASGDLSFAGGHFHPNKAPATSLLAVPAYALLHAADALGGRDPDHWWTLTRNAWLSTAASVGLLSALGVVLFLHVSLRLWPGHPRSATWAALTFGFGTLYAVYASQLLEQNPAAVGLLAVYAAGLEARRAESPRRRALAWAAAGAAAGAAVAASYLALLALPLVLVRLGIGRGERARTDLAGLAAGAALPLLGLAVYHQLAFGAPWATAYGFENPLFRSEGALLGVLGWPRPERALALLVSPFRGLWLASPVLLLALAACCVAPRPGLARPDPWLCIGAPALLWLFNASFNGWHGGWAVGPRYLVAALPFAALPLTPCFARWPRWTGVAALLSVLAMGLAAAVDPQSPVGVAPLAERGDRPQWARSPWAEYLVPLFVRGRARPILAAQIRERAEQAERSMEAHGTPLAERERLLGDFRERAERAIEEGSPQLPLSYFAGPVSAHPIGVYEPWLGTLFAPLGEEARWNSFNAGELLWPGRRLSLLPLLGVCPALAGLALRRAGKAAA